MINFSHSKLSDNAPNIVLIHGLFGDKDNLNGIKSALLPHCNLISIDLPDHGKSSHTEKWSFANCVAQLNQLLDDISFYPCSILGHSLGGKVAMAMALTHPNKINQIIVADIAPASYPSRHDNVFKALNAVQAETISSRKQAQSILDDILIEPGVAQFLLKSLKKQNETWQWQFNLEGLQRDYLTDIIQWPYSDQTFSGDVLFIKGGNSDYITQQHGQQIKIHFPNASYKIISGTGHWLHAQKPVIFNKLVMRMLGIGI